MLRTLRIRDYALIDDVELEFREGFNVLTGETGAGKSIVVGALNLVLGARASNETVRDGAKQAKIDAVFYLPEPSARLQSLLEEHGIELEDDELLISRVISAQGRSKAYAAGSLAPVSVLAAIGDELVDLHGQHEHQSLLAPRRQLELLDGYAKLGQLVGEVKTSVERLRKITKTIAELETDDRDKARRLDFLKYEVAEIDQASLEPGEEEDLKQRRSRIANAETIYTLAGKARGALSESEDGSSALEKTTSVSRDMEELALLDAGFAPLLDELREVEARLGSLGEELRNHTQEVEYDPAELDSINGRLSQIRDLQRKYGDTVEAILEYRKEAAVEVETLENRDERLAELVAERERLSKEAEGLAEALSVKRRAAARILDKEVSGILNELGMRGATIETIFEPIPLSSTGVDHAEYHLAANKGAKARPLRSVASGGEISRVMLAIKAVFAETDEIPTLIFDEIDAGVGGAVATKVSEKLAQLAESHQTICITHLPQIAAAASTHFSVSKSTARGKTRTRVEQIQNESRVDEVARLLDGSLSEVSVKHARALLDIED